MLQNNQLIKSIQQFRQTISIRPRKKSDYFKFLEDDCDPVRGQNNFMDIEKDTYDRQLDLYKLLRNQIEHEDEVINNRLTWSLTAQGFLFVAYSALLGLSLKTPLSYIFLIVIGIVGVQLCDRAISGVDSAIASLNRIHTYERRHRKYSIIRYASHLKLPPISGAGSKQNDQEHGANESIQSIPRNFRAAWMVLIIAPICLLCIFALQNQYVRALLPPNNLQSHIQFVVAKDAVETVKNLNVDMEATNPQQTKSMILIDETDQGYLVALTNSSPTILIGKNLVQGVIYVHP
jgi:hypothetical protein